MSIADILIALLVIAVWGLNFVALRVGLNGVPPMLLVAARFMLCAFPAVFLIRRPAVPWRHLIAYGLAMGVLQFSLLYGALSIGMPAGLSSIVMQSQAFFTLGFGALFLKEQIKSRQVVGMAIAGLGLLLIALSFDQQVGPLPLLMVIGAAAGWGLANVMARQAGRVNMLAFVVWTSLVPPIPMLILSLLIEGPARIEFTLTHLSGLSIVAALFTAYLSTVLGYALWNRLISRNGAGQVAPFSLLVPFFGLSSTALLLGETMSPATLVAGGLVLIGLAITVFGLPRFVARPRGATNLIEIRERYAPASPGHIAPENSDLSGVVSNHVKGGST
ncbi:MAG: EamA family transporter [Anaerolineae bacterium]|nr:EamA family transporter [Anaerolineae bacterium]